MKPSKHRQNPQSERGIALLSVLLLVAVMAIITTLVLDRVNLAVRLAGNAQAQDRSRFLAMGVEAFAASEIKRRLALSPSRTVDTGNWLGTAQTLPLDEGASAVATITVTDGGNCFNLNSVVQGKPGSFTVRPEGVKQFIGLMGALGTDQRDAIPLAQALVDWIDSDQIAQPAGAENQYYGSLAEPYRTSGALLIDSGELLALNGITVTLYQRLLPWVCALPDNTLSPLNVNTLQVDRAPLLVMLAPDVVDLRRARLMIESRPALGYARLADFWRPVSGGQSRLLPEIEAQPQLVTRWFNVDISIADGNAVWRQNSLLDAQADPARIVHRRLGEQ